MGNIAPDMSILSTSLGFFCDKKPIIMNKMSIFVTEQSADEALRQHLLKEVRAKGKKSCEFELKQQKVIKKHY